MLSGVNSKVHPWTHAYVQPDGRYAENGVCSCCDPIHQCTIQSPLVVVVVVVKRSGESNLCSFAQWAASTMGRDVLKENQREWTIAIGWMAAVEFGC
jgi:hypothetical protein